MLIEGPNQQPQDTKGGDNETQEDSHKSAPEAPPPTAPPNLPVAASDEYDSYEGKNYRLSQKQFVAAKITLIVLAIYTGIAGYQAWKMRQATGAAITQTQLLSAQLKGTMSATVRLEEPRFTPDPVTQELTLVILFINGGHIIAPKTNAALRIETLSFPDLKTVLNSRTEMLTINEFGAGGSYSKLITVHDFPGQIAILFPRPRQLEFLGLSAMTTDLETNSRSRSATHISVVITSRTRAMLEVPAGVMAFILVIGSTNWCLTFLSIHGNRTG